MNARSSSLQHTSLGHPSLLAVTFPHLFSDIKKVLQTGMGGEVAPNDKTSLLGIDIHFGLRRLDMLQHDYDLLDSSLGIVDASIVPFN
jgi:hypothetical protein